MLSYIYVSMVHAYAQAIDVGAQLASSAQPGSEPAVKPDLLHGVLDALTKFGSGGIIVSVALAVEFVLRLVPSAKPKSIMYLVADSLRVVGQICQKAAEILDRILPQRLK